LAQLDPLLRALVERRAQELVLADGDRPALRFGQALRPVSPKTLTRPQINVLLSELADRIEAARLAAGESIRFVYQLPDGRPFLCDAGEVGGTFRASLTLHEALRPGVGDASRAAPDARPTATSDAGSGVASDVAPRVEPHLETPVEPDSATPIVAREGEPELATLLERMVRQGASDLHLSAGEVPRLRLDGEMVPLDDLSPVSAERALELIEGVMPEHYRDEYRRTHDCDFAYEIPGVARFRVNVFTDRKGPGTVVRTIPAKIMTAKDLGLPAAVIDLCRLTKGLVLVTGPTGSGKSTTLAAMVDHINRTRSEHIITIEDPIEFVHENQRCLVNQREVFSHTRDFKTALRAALREDPDIVLVGEMRDLETIAIAIETAETGHLVFGTLHTTSACSTVDRIIDQFPADRQAQIRTMLSESLRGVVSQTLLKRVGGGRVAALEILKVTPAISNLIREGKTFQIPSIMQTARKQGMVLMNDALVDLVKRRVVEPAEAWLKSTDKHSIEGAFRGAGIAFQPERVD